MSVLDIVLKIFLITIVFTTDVFTTDFLTCLAKKDAQVSNDGPVLFNCSKKM